ncbi:hypothetical protein [Geodermatophilus maliterrae]|uniref:Uncharacterized protein n=1 Tax=Geodermatophilus maliterrae TaxID=3162531 RepID=A0ABV3XID4_9ACTN
MSGIGARSGGEVLVGGGVRQGWWLVVDEVDGSERVVAGPFGERAEAGWAAGAQEPGTHLVHGFRRADGGLARRPSPQDGAWLVHLGEQLDRLPEDWDTVLSDDDAALGTLVVEVTAALCEAGLALHDATGTGGASLLPEPALGGIVVSWLQHDRMSVDQVHGDIAHALVQQAMNQVLADVLALRGFAVDPLGGAHVVRRAG